ncbi:MAG TPA: prenyltransferase/squalene oxidase repeat-containing protein [Planctomycetota bacterium]|nr:prenyltransferase/squalene oxidase repeat-containing protein [Planctomycetota bacterium]
MRNEPLGNPSAQARDDEAALEQYIETPSPLRDWLEAKIRQAPWWCISFLVHLLALLALWTWPMQGEAQSVTEIERKIELWEEPKTEEWHDWDVVKPIEPTKEQDFEIDEIYQEPVAGDQSAGTPQLKESDLSPESQTPRFEVEIPRPEFVEVKPGPDGTRDDIRGVIDGEPDDGKERKKKVIEILTPLQAALVWLARAQEKDGSWDAKRWEGASSYRVGMTGLALLAYQGAGFTHIKGHTFRKAAAGALDWLRTNQRENGSFPWETFYEQGIATMAVCEAYGMTSDSRLRPSAQRAVDYIVKLQPEHGGFRYGGAVPQAEGDLSVAGWQIMAIKSALLAGLKVPPEAVERSRVFLKSTWRDYGASAYLAGDKGAGSLSMTAVGLLCRLFLNDGGVYQGEIAQAAQFLAQREAPDIAPPERGASKQLVTDIYYTYYSSLAMYHVAGPDSEYWRAWKIMHLEPLKAAQVRVRQDARGNFVKGSFDPAKHRWGDRGGRVYTTAMAALCFEAPFRFLPLCRAKR